MSCAVARDANEKLGRKSQTSSRAGAVNHTPKSAKQLNTGVDKPKKLASKIKQAETKRDKVAKRDKRNEVVDQVRFTKYGKLRAAGASRAPGTFTPEKRSQFLEHYQTGLTVLQAAKKVGTTAVTVFNYVRKDDAFAKQYRRAMEANTDVLEDGLHHLARNGNIAAIFGTLKARRPERWRDRVDISNKDGSLLRPLAEAIKRAHGQVAAVPVSEDEEARTH